MSKNWWFKFDYRVWRTDSRLRRCSLETRGFWLELLCAMYEADECEVTGSYEEIGWLVGCDAKIVARCAVELQRTKTADVTLGNGTVTFLSRRLKSELSDREKTRLRVQRHRGNADVTAQSKSKSKSKNKKEEEEGVSIETRPSRNKATRLPDPFPITPEMWAWLATNQIHLEDVQTAHDEWVEYWTNCTTVKAVKPRWDLAWQKGMKKAAEWQAERKNNNGRPVSEREKSAQRGTNAVAIIDELRRQGLAEEQAISGRGNGFGPPDTILIESAQSN